MSDTWGIVGHRWAVQQLQHTVSEDVVPHAILITGPDSVGKSVLAEQLIAAMLCRSEGERPCGTCLSCRKLRSGNHPDFMLIEPEDKTAHVKIEQIRDVERFLALTPNESAHKIVLIRHFERATIGAANALLKTLEEPPGYAHLILLATEADVLLPTIVSRAQQIPLHPVASGEIAAALVDRWHMSPEEARRLARMSGGRVGWAVRAATDPETYGRMIEAIDTLLAVLGQELPARFETAQALSRDDAALAETLEHWITFWRDVLLLQTGNGDTLVFAEKQDALQAMAANMDVKKTVRVLAELNSAQEALLANANTQLLVESLLLGLPTLAIGADN